MGVFRPCRSIARPAFRLGPRVRCCGRQATSNSESEGKVMGATGLAGYHEETLYLWLARLSTTTPSVKPWPRFHWTNASCAPLADQIGDGNAGPASGLGRRAEVGRQAAPLLGLGRGPYDPRQIQAGQIPRCHEAYEFAGRAPGRSQAGPLGDVRAAQCRKHRRPPGGPTRAPAFSKAHWARGINSRRLKSPAAPCGSGSAGATAPGWPPPPSG